MTQWSEKRDSGSAYRVILRLWGGRLRYIGVKGKRLVGIRHAADNVSHWVGPGVRGRWARKRGSGYVPLLMGVETKKKGASAFGKSRRGGGGAEGGRREGYKSPRYGGGTGCSRGRETRLSRRCSGSQLLKPGRGPVEGLSLPRGRSGRPRDGGDREQGPARLRRAAIDATLRGATLRSPRSKVDKDEPGGANGGVGLARGGADWTRGGRGERWGLLGTGAGAAGVGGTLIARRAGAGAGSESPRRVRVSDPPAAGGSSGSLLPRTSGSARVSTDV